MQIILAALNALYLGVVPPHVPPVHGDAAPLPTAFLIGIAAGILLVLVLQGLLRLTRGRADLTWPIRGTSQSTIRRSFPVHGVEAGHGHHLGVPELHH